MPSNLKERYYELGEAAKATGIPRGSLDHACRNGRLPYTWSERGSRLISESTVKRLHQQGLAAFPRAYIDPVPGPGPQPQQEKPTSITPRPTAAERMGLLGEPSGELTNAKEEAERAKLAVEKEEASLSLLRIRREKELERKALEADREQEEEERRAREEGEAEADKREEIRRREEERKQLAKKRHEDWLREQMKLTMQECKDDFGYFAPVPPEREREAFERLAQEIFRLLGSLDPRTSPVRCREARRTAINRALCPYRWTQLEKKVFDRGWSDPVKEHLDNLYGKGFLDLPQEQRAILAQRLRPKVIEAVRREFYRRGEMTEREATEFLRSTVDRLV